MEFKKAYETISNFVKSHSEKFDEELKVLKKAVELCTPKKPIFYYEEQWGRWCECPNCKNEICGWDDSNQIGYCQECGQSLDWSEDEQD